MFPAAASPGACGRLWQAVREGWLTAVGSDHCALDGGYEGAKKKRHQFFQCPPTAVPSTGPAGPAVDIRCVHRKKSPAGNSWSFSANPAKVVGLPNKGELRIGADADVVIFDPEWKGIITNKDSLHGIDYEPFEGFEIQDGPAGLSARLVVAKKRQVCRRTRHGALAEMQALRSVL